MGGFFISFEGIEGGGKTTQIPLLAEALRKEGHEVIVTREPGGTSVGQVLRGLLLEPSATPLAPVAELLLMLADRAQHVQEVVAPGLRANKIVISDRYMDSTTAYQGYGRGIALDWLTQLNTFACGGYIPALTLLLDLPVEEGLRRTRQRQSGAAMADQFEAESLAFHERVRAGFLKIAGAYPERVRTVGAARPIREVHQSILEIVHDRLKEHVSRSTSPR